MKPKHSSIRLDEATQAIVENHQQKFGDAPSISETVQRMIQAADGKMFVSVLSTSVAPTEELSFYAGQLDKTRLLWREIKSRLNAPRPLDQTDTAALKQWREDRQKIEKFYVECDSLWKNARALAETLTKTSPAEWAVMQEAADKLKNWIDYYEGLAKKESDPASKQENLSYVAECKAIVALLHRLGIDPNPPKPAVPAGQGGLKSLLR